MKKCFFYLMGILCVACSKKAANADVAKTPVIILQPNPFVKVQYGNMPLVITVPHGGLISPDSIPDRSCPNITTAVDIYTLEMAAAIDSIAKADYGVQPYFITTSLKRIKIDQNRSIDEATCSNPAKADYWYSFHNYTDSCIKKILAKYPSCLYVDLHAHGHTIQRLELGYLISASQLNVPSSINSNSTSFKYLFTANPTLTMQQILTGPNAFGSLMAQQGYPSVPSNAMVAPAIGDQYFDGGYNTARYTALNKVFGLQIESNYDGVRASANQRVAFAKAFMNAVMQYHAAFTGLKLEDFGR